MKKICIYIYLYTSCSSNAELQISYSFIVIIKFFNYTKLLKSMRAITEKLSYVIERENCQVLANMLMKCVFQLRRIGQIGSENDLLLFVAQIIYLIFCTCHIN